MDFATALQRTTTTENGMAALPTSGKDLVDLFFMMGAARQLDDDTLRRLFEAAYREDPSLAVKALFYNRDVRGGQGERRSFRVMFHWLCQLDPLLAAKNLPNVPFYGRWDDLFAAVGTPIEQSALAAIAIALLQGDKLCAKWMPREGKANSKDANTLRLFLGLTWKDYRKLLAGSTQVVETLMCSKRWSEINYSQVPSQAIHKYRKAFVRNDPVRYSAWLADLARPGSGAKINAGAIFPHQLVQPHLRYFGYDSLVQAEEAAQLEAQWAALPDYMPKGRKVLPLCDVSGSMDGLPMYVSIALGLYIAERNTGPFRNCVLTFESQPQFFALSGATLRDRVNELAMAPWGGSTNFEAALQLILDKAVAVSLPADEMPDTLLVLSDMQFDQASGHFDYTRPNPTAFELFEQRYAAAGYRRPQIVFWNLRAAPNVPVTFRQDGTALVSGFSPSLLQSVLRGDDLTPLGAMLATLNAPRYDQVVTA